MKKQMSGATHFSVQGDAPQRPQVRSARSGGHFAILAASCALALGLTCLAATGADAAARQFTYTYETGVLNPGAIEFELWTTARVGRSEYYNRFDERFEFEIGLADRLQTALYVNVTALSRDQGNTRESEFEFKGISSEWKYKVSDPVADVIGSALYLEVTGSPNEAELEGKLIFDKRMGNLLLACNLVGEYEWEFEEPDTVTEAVFEFDAGVAYFFLPSLSAGVELRVHNEFPENEGLEHSVLFLGPVVSYAKANWWVALTVLPQVAALKGSTDGGLNLEEHERVETRLLLGLHF